jgi:hypothetical protein
MMFAPLCMTTSLVFYKQFLEICILLWKIIYSLVLLTFPCTFAFDFLQTGLHFHCVQKVSF